MYTPMHRALGRQPSEVTWELLQACVDAKVPESDDLDWKGRLPWDTKKPDWTTEWAKDVAAMANTAGGCLVYGIQEKPGAGTADQMVDVGPVGDSVESRLRQAAAANLRPLVQRLDFIPVASADGQFHALVVRVPASTDVPHLLPVGNAGGFRAPHRYGSTTEWMTERMLEDTYRRRFRRTSELREMLDERYGAAERHVKRDAQDLRVWVVGAAVPLEPQPELEFTPAQAAARLRVAHDLYQQMHGRPVDRSIYDLNTMPGLRRLIAGGPYNTYQIDLHFDAGVTFVEVLNDASPPGRNAPVAPTDEIEKAVARLVSVLAATARATGEITTYVTQVGLVWWHYGKPVHLGRPKPLQIGREYQLVERPVHEVETSTREVRADDDIAGLRRSARVLALDLLRQGGVADTTFIVDDDDA